MRRLLSFLLAVAAGLMWATGAPAQPFMSSQEAAQTAASLRQISNAKLLTMFESMVLDFDPRLATRPFDGNLLRMFVDEEILFRGTRITPELLQMLRRPGLLRSVIERKIELLHAIGDPVSVPALLDHIEADEIASSQNKDLVDWRYSARHAVEGITFTRFRRAERYSRGCSASVELPQAQPIDSTARFVKLYREWLSGQGKDPSQWLAQASARAHKNLEGKDLEEAYCAASFLTEGSGKRDKEPEHTVAAIGEILKKAVRATNVPGKKDTYQVDGKEMPIYGWLNLLTETGPRARPFASTLIRLSRETGLENEFGLARLWRVGGKEITAYSIGLLPVIAAKVDEIQRNPASPKAFHGDDPRLWWLSSLRECRWTIDRWAGQIFGSDTERLAWWQANRDKSEEQWLRESLPIAARNADKRKNHMDETLFHELVPDSGAAAKRFDVQPEPLQEKRAEENAASRLRFVAARPDPFREKWVEQNAARLRYDPRVGKLLLPPPER
jgi:hypothetical protein